MDLWNRMTKLIFINWDDQFKNISLKAKNKEYQLQATTNLISMLLVIAKSERDLDLQAHSLSMS